MGMYDTVYFEYDVTIKKVKYIKPVFQTKNLDCLLDNYFITPQKRIFKEIRTYRSLSKKEEQEYIKKWEEEYGKKWSSSSWNIVPQKLIKKERETVNFTGCLELHDYNESLLSCKYPYWIEVKAFFQKGLLKKIICENYVVYKDRLKEVNEKKQKYINNINQLIKSVEKLTLEEAIKFIAASYHCKLVVAKKVALAILSKRDIDVIIKLLDERFSS